MRVVGVDQQVNAIPFWPWVNDHPHGRFVYQLRSNKDKPSGNGVRFKHHGWVIQPLRNLFPLLRRHEWMVVLSGNHFAFYKVDAPLTRAQQVKHV